MTVRRLLKQCEEDREAEVTRRQRTDERLLQVLEANRMMTSQMQSGYDSAAAQLQVNQFLMILIIVWQFYCILRLTALRCCHHSSKQVVLQFFYVLYFDHI